MTRGVGGQSPANVTAHLKGLDFPAKKNTIIEHAKKAGGVDTEEVVKFLKQLPDKEFKTPAEVMEGYGKIK